MGEGRERSFDSFAVLLRGVCNNMSVKAVHVSTYLFYFTYTTYYIIFTNQSFNRASYTCTRVTHFIVAGRFYYNF